MDKKIPCGAVCEARRGIPDPPSQKTETRPAERGREENNGHNGNYDLVVGNVHTFPRSVGVLALYWACVEINENVLWPSYIPKSASYNP
jgi:hypothetical protein